VTVHFGRAWVVELGDVKIESTDGRGVSNRVVFEVERDDTTIPNRASIAIYNLAPDTLARLRSAPENLPCRIQAGYTDNYQQIFAGELRRGLVSREGADFAFRAAAGEGTEKVQSSRISKTWPKNIEYKQIITELSELLGVGTIQDASKGAITGALSSSLTLKGDTGYELTELLRGFGCRWFITGDTLTIQLLDTILSEPGILIESFIREPELVWVKDKQTQQKQQFLKCTTILQPELYPGVGVEVGEFGAVLVKASKHRGDTHSATWEVEFEGKLL
jgi:hypothetical protein